MYQVSFKKEFFESNNVTKCLLDDKITMDDFDWLMLSSPEPEIRDSVSEIKPDFGPDSDEENTAVPEPKTSVPELQTEASASEIKPSSDSEENQILQEGKVSPVFEPEIKPDGEPDSEENKISQEREVSPDSEDGNKVSPVPEPEIGDFLSDLKLDYESDSEEDNKVLSELEIKLDFGSDSEDENKTLLNLQ